MTGSPDPDQFWAKLRYRDDDPSTGEIVEWHPLVAHSADVSGVRMMALFDTNLLIDAAVASRSHHGAAVRLIAAAE
jgi:CRISPR-associated endonuclease/helicase Cas3